MTGATRADGARLRALFASLDEAVFEIAGDGRIVSVTPPIQKLAGYAPEDLVGRRFGGFVCEADRARLIENFSKTLASGIGGRVRFGVGHVEGHSVQVEARVATFPASHCELRLLAVLRPAHAILDEIPEAAAALVSPSQRGRAPRRRESNDPRELDLNALVARLDRMLRQLIGDDAVLTTLLEGDIWPVRADADQIEQLLVNLVVNARDAMPSGGHITLETSNETRVATVSSAESDASDGVPDGDWVILTVRADQGGTDLGLSTVSDIAAAAGGHVRVDAQPGGGSRFRVYLPRSSFPVSGCGATEIGTDL